MFDSIAIIPALVAVGVFAAALLPKASTATEYRPWTEADFNAVMHRELTPS